jgi:hypothetical protein
MVTFVLTLILSNMVTKLFQVIRTAFFVRHMHGLYECLDLFFFRSRDMNAPFTVINA